MTQASPRITQTEVIAFLSRPETWGAPVERIDTHSASVFLTGDRALKLKRAVRYGYLDFSTLDLRKHACEAEVAINRRTAPAVYLGTRPVTWSPSRGLAVGGNGTGLDGNGLDDTAVEWLVDMRRFDQEHLLDRLAASGRLDAALMHELADAVARFHRDAAIERTHGGYEGIVRVIRGNAAGMAAHGTGILDPAACRRLEVDTLAAADDRRALLERRREAGFVRRCHGDLHLRNLVLIDGEPTLFDAIEFNDDLACVDVWYDVAFLLMDLIKRGLPVHANVLFNRYLLRQADDEGVALLPLYLSCRAAVRAMTSATAARVQTDANARTTLEQLARDYLALAAQFLRTTPPILVAIGGLSGSGKSTLARALAPTLGHPPGAAVLRSDEVRKALLDVDLFTRLGADGYSPELSERVYDTLAKRARTLLRAGWATIVDAVFATPLARRSVEETARETGQPFVGLWLEGPAEVLRARVRARVGDASDADTHVLERQLGHDIGEVTWRRLDASLSPDRVQPLASRVIEEHRDAQTTDC